MALGEVTYLRPRRRSFERHEPRQEALRIVDYTLFPRTARNPRPRVGFTRDISRSGMCIGVDSAEAPGSLLRVTLRNLDGTTARCGTWQVMWCQAASDGRFWVGLMLVADARARRATS